MPMATPGSCDTREGVNTDKAAVEGDCGVNHLQLKHHVFANLTKTNDHGNTVVGPFLGLGRDLCKGGGQGL